MNFEIREIPREEPHIQDTFDLCRSAFPGIKIDKLRSNWIGSNTSSMFLGAYAGNRLAGANGFIAHPTMLRGQPGVAYQSCWSATHPDFRGNGLFSAIIEHAKKTLRGRATMICGFPNSVSGPIFTGKLGFSEVPMVRNVMVARGPERMLQAQIDVERCYQQLAKADLVRFDQYMVAEWKRKELGLISVVEHNTNLLWGFVGTRNMAGIRTKVFIAGGIEINKPQLFGRLLQQTSRASGAALIRFVSVRGSVLSEAARWTQPGDQTEPFIFFPLDVDGRDLVFDAHTGMKDVF